MGKDTVMDQTIAAITSAEPIGVVLTDEYLGPSSTSGRRPWVAEAYHRLRQLDGLRANWDARGSAAISVDALVFALQVLQRVMPPSGPAPSIHPLGHGGVQLSW